MAVTALVTLGSTLQSSGTLTALVGTEARGLQDTPSTPPFGPYAGKALFQITTYADDSGESMGFQFVVGGGMAMLAERLTFVINANIGNAVGPLLLSGEVGGASMDEEDDDDLGYTRI